MLKKKSGIVQSFNVSPKGSYEGVLLNSGDDLLQINFPQEYGASIAAIASPGDRVRAEVEPQDPHPHACHPVFALRKLSNEQKQSFSLDQPNGKDNGRFSGKVARLNYALHGEVNGAILDNGDFLHVKPHGASALALSVGMSVKGVGPKKPMIDGHHVIEAEQVNGVHMEKKPKPKKKAHR